ncbi:MAG TPA: MarR family transcriptional regulator [Candidatus Angelobacter sp.]|nr:MarR family transcriptional regulator [Candidatus Angelobacter sp.]
MNITTKLPSHTLSFCLRLAKANAALVRRFDGRLGTLHGIGFGDFMVLLALSQAPGAKLRRIDLAGELGLTASAVTRTLIPLEKIGLVKRQHDPRDARVGYATLTESGRRILAESLASAEVVSQDALPRQHAAELQPLAEVLGQIGSL